MALNIKDAEADRLARELAGMTGESLTQAVVQALRERVRHETRNARRAGLKDEIMAISRRSARLPRHTDQTPEQIIGYDDSGLPR